MVKRRMVSVLLVLLILSVSIISIGCNNKDVSILTSENKEVVLGENEYQIYYLNKDKTALKSKVIKYSGSSDVVDMAKEFITYINQAMVEESTDVSTKVQVVNVTFSGDILTVDFDKSYSQANDITEILIRACLVLTLTQIDDVINVGITVNGQTIKDEAGNTITKMKAEDFVNFKDNFPYTKKEVTMILYFADETGTMLKKKEIVCYYDYTISYEKFIINRLIEGVNKVDSDNGYKATLPKKTVIDMVYTKDGVCYVDFDESIMKTVRPISTELLLYSIVNSLSELSYITKVQFSVEGESDIKLYNEYDLSEQFSRNLDIVIKEETKN